MSSSPDGKGRAPGFSSPGASPIEGDLLSLLPGLRRYSRSLSRSDADGEDLLQDCLEKALDQGATWRGTNFKAWIYAIMTNLNRNDHRRTVRNAVVSLEEAPDIAAPAADGDALERDRLQAALDGLPADYRSVLMLVVLEGYSYEEVADLLHIPIGTVMSRLSRARQRLRDVLAARNIIAIRRPKP